MSQLFESIAQATKRFADAPVTKEEIEEERQRIMRNPIFRYPANYYIFQHRDVRENKPRLSKRQAKLVYQDVRKTLDTRETGKPEIFFMKNRK